MRGKEVGCFLGIDLDVFKVELVLMCYVWAVWTRNLWVCVEWEAGGDGSMMGMDMVDMGMGMEIMFMIHMGFISE